MNEIPTDNDSTYDHMIKQQEPDDATNDSKHLNEDQLLTETMNHNVDHSNSVLSNHLNDEFDEDDEFGDFDSAPAMSSSIDNNDIQSTDLNTITDNEQKSNDQSNITDQSQHSIQDDHDDTLVPSLTITNSSNQSTSIQSLNELDNNDDDDEFGDFDSAPAVSSIDDDIQSTPSNMIADPEGKSNESSDVDHSFPSANSMNVEIESLTHLPNQEHSDNHASLTSDEVPTAFQITDDEDDEFGDFDSAPVPDSVSVESSDTTHMSLDDSLVQTVSDNVIHPCEDPIIAISPRSLGDPTDQLSDLDMPHNNPEIFEPVKSEDHLHSSHESPDTNKEIDTTTQDNAVSNDTSKSSDSDSDSVDSSCNHQPLQRVDEILSHQAPLTTMHDHTANVAESENPSLLHNVESANVDDPFAVLDSVHSVSPLPSLGDSVVFVPSRPSSALPVLDDDRPPLDLSSAVTSTVQSTVNSNVASPRLSLNQQTIFDEIQDEEFDDFASASSSIHPSLIHSLTVSPDMRQVHTIPEDEELGDISVSVGQSAMNSPPEMSADLADLDDDDFGEFTTSQSFDVSRSVSATYEHEKPPAFAVLENVSDKITDELIVRTYESERIVVDTFVSPGSTVRTSISRSLEVCISQTDVLVQPEISADNEDDWGDFDAAPATVEQEKIGNVNFDQTAPAADDDDWSDFNEANQSSSVSIESSSFSHHTPARIFPVDFLDLQGQQLHDNIKQKLGTLFSEEIASVNAASAVEYQSVDMSGPPCISCGGSTPVLGSLAVKTIPRVCWKCGKAINSSAQSALGNALVSLPRFRNSATYHSLFLALGLPIPTPTPKLAKNLLKDSAGDAHDDDGLNHSTTDDHVDHAVDADDDETSSHSVESKHKLSTSNESEPKQTSVELAPIHAAIVSPVANISTSRHSVAVTSPDAAVSSPRQITTTSNSTPATAMAIQTHSPVAINNQISPASRPSPRVPPVASPPAAAPVTSIGSVTRPRTLEDIERMRAEEKAAKRAADKLALEAQIAAKKANKSAIGGLTGKLSKLGQSLTKITPSAKKIDGPSNAISSPSINSVTSHVSHLDLDSVARAINQLSMRLPDLSWASVRH